MIKQLFTHNLYIKVDINKFEAKNLSLGGEWHSSYSDKPFTTERLLVGSFTEAATVLRTLVNNLLPKSFITKTPQVIIHPVAMVDGGLSEVEERIFKELALGSGAKKVFLHTGQELSDKDAINLIRST